MDLKPLVRSIKDFPKPGIVFRDITTLIGNGQALKQAASELAEHFRKVKPEVVVGIESRGFIIGAAVALTLGVGFVPVRKPKKLPFRTIRQEYALEYGSDAIEMHADAIEVGRRVLIIDDLLATGGTAKACCQLVEQSGGKIVGLGFLINLAFLAGAKRLNGYNMHWLIQYDSE